MSTLKSSEIQMNDLLDLAVAERDGCVGKGFQWQHFAGEG